MLHLIVPFKPDERHEGTITRRASSWLKHMLLARQYTRLRFTDGYFPDRPYREYYLVGWSFGDGRIVIRYSLEPSSSPSSLTFPHMLSVSPPPDRIMRAPPNAQDDDDETKTQIYEGMASRAKAAGERRWQVVAPSKKAKLQARMAAVRAAKLSSSSDEEEPNSLS